MRFHSKGRRPLWCHDDELAQPVFGPAEIDRERIHVLDWTNYETQDERIKADGGLDMVLLGVDQMAISVGIYRTRQNLEI